VDDFPMKSNHFIEPHQLRDRKILDYKQLYSKGMINFDGWIDLKLDSKLNSNLIENIFISEDIFTPTTITEALTCQHKLQWMKAIDNETDRINFRN
jgi:hypothetical protein